MTLQAVAQNGSPLDPVTIEELATTMAEQTWVDARVVPGGIAERVRIEGILIRRDEEEVQLAQELRDEDGEVSVHRFWVHSEEIWWVKPTQFSATDELRAFQPTGQRQSADSVLSAAFESVAHYFRVTAAEVKAIARARLDDNHYRYWVMLVYKELNPKASDLEVTKLFDYGSPQPLYSARDHARRNNGETKMEAMVRHAKGLLP